MTQMIEIDGKEFEVLGTVRESGGFGIHTNAGTFWMKPCKPKLGQAAFWMGENGFEVQLPPECPERISRITFDEPDFTEQYPDEVKADYRKYKTHCKKAGEQALPFDQYKKQVAVFNVWERHGTPELALQYGYIEDEFVIYFQILEGQKIDPACLHKFKWAAEYMDEDGNGEVVFFERLARDPLPKGYRKTDAEDEKVNNRIKIVFANNFKRVCFVCEDDPFTLKLIESPSKKALQYLYENREQGWLQWEQIIRAADNPTEWSNPSRSPKGHMIRNSKDDKKSLFGKIIIEEKNSTGWQVRLDTRKYQFSVK